MCDFFFLSQKNVWILPHTFPIFSHKNVQIFLRKCDFFFVKTKKRVIFLLINLWLLFLVSLWISVVKTRLISWRFGTCLSRKTNADFFFLLNLWLLFLAHLWISFIKTGLFSWKFGTFSCKKCVTFFVLRRLGNFFFPLSKCLTCLLETLPPPHPPPHPPPPSHKSKTFKSKTKFYLVDLLLESQSFFSEY